MILRGNALTMPGTLPDESVQCCVTSPPYWGLRDYGVKGQLGLESTPELYVAHPVEIFREVRRVLRANGTLWLNLGDCYATGAGKSNQPGGGYRGAHDADRKRPQWAGPYCQPNRMPIVGLKAKDLVGIPWRVAFALQADGWYLRSDIIWHKPNPMPESVRDRPTKAHEYIFLLSKSERYYYAADAIAEACVTAGEAKYDNGRNGHAGGVSHAGQGSSTRKFRASGNRVRKVGDGTNGRLNNHLGYGVPWPGGLKRNKRSVWTIATKPYKGAHFATFPPALIEPCILAGSAPGDTVLDPFAGSGTTAIVAQQLGREWIAIELNAGYCQLIRQRVTTKAA